MGECHDLSRQSSLVKSWTTRRCYLFEVLERGTVTNNSSWIGQFLHDKDIWGLLYPKRIHVLSIVGDTLIKYSLI